MYDIQNKLRELVALWANPVAANLARILDICKEIGDAATAGHLRGQLDPAQLCRIRVLSCQAEERIAGCTASGVGSAGYGAPAKRRVSTTQWEG